MGGSSSAAMSRFLAMSAAPDAARVTEADGEKTKL
jgi:hypothetical protein